jgi:ubiquinone/menaquinone biosynthesis C-methylase UbiE
MNTSRSFDQAAEYYDKTRPLHDSGVEIQSLLDAAGKGMCILEVGTGTGRISIPLAERGADLVGCDLSSKMLSRQREKYPAARLVRSDAAFLPFPSKHFDAVLVVHVMHLIGLWREALHEIKRVLRPGGVFLHVSTYEVVGKSPRAEMRQYWRNWLTAQGLDMRHPGAQTGDEVRTELRSMEARIREVDVKHFSFAYTPRIELDRYANRVFSDTWSVPDALYQASLADLRDWAMKEFGDLDQQLEETNRFVFDVVNFDDV